MPKISVIMPILNSAAYLRECMDSVVGQTLKDIEIIPVDAGSTDGSLEILEEYAKRDRRIRIIRSTRKSVGYQYNLGLAEAQGEYIGFVESDDYIALDMFEILLSYAEKYELDWVKGNYICFMDYPRLGRQLIPVSDEKYCKTGTVFNPQECPKQYIREIFICRGIYNRNFIRKNEIRLNETDGASFQDTGFILQAFIYATRAFYINDYLYYYRRDNQGASSHQVNTIRFEINEVEYITNIIRKNPDLYKAFWGVNYIRAMERFLSSYERVPRISECEEDILRDVKHYRDYLMNEISDQDNFWELCEMSAQFKELTWLMESLERFDEEYRRIDMQKENLLRNGIQKVLNWPKVIIFGCGDNGSGIISLLLRLNRNEIVCLSDNDEHKWNQNYMGIPVIPPMNLKVDRETMVLIANKKNFYEIRAQLIGLGISDRQIWLCPQIMRIRGTNILREGDVLPLK
jgi:glycosyltransferase involved in cell wall biosynthesis